MRKSVFIVLTVVSITASLSTFTSCREKKTTGEKIEDVADDIGDGVEDVADDIGDGVEDVADDIEDAID